MDSHRFQPFRADAAAIANPLRDRLVGAVLLAALIAGWVGDVTPLAALRLWGTDLVSALRPPASHPSAVVVVDIDDASLRAFGQWPWPRDTLAGIVDRLAEEGAAAVALDILLAEPDRLSPAAGGPDTDNDLALARAMRRVPVIAAAALSTAPAPPAEAQPIIGRVAVHGILRPQALPQASTLVRPLPALEAAARGLGAVNLYPGLDSVVRTVPGIVAFDGSLLPGLAIEAVRVATGAANLIAEVPTSYGPAGLSIAGRLVPTDLSGRIWVDTRDPERIPVVSAGRLLAGGVPPAELAGRLAVVGTSASGISAGVLTGAGQAVSSTTFQALAIDSILGGRVLARPVEMTGLELATAAALAGGVILAAPVLGLPMLGLVAVAAVMLLPVAAIIIALSAGIMADASFPLVAVLAMTGHVALVRVHEQSVVRRRQDAMLARQGAYMRQVVDASFDAIVTVDGQGRIVTANAGAERLFGRPVDQLVGLRIESLLTGTWAEAVRLHAEGALRDAVRSGRVVSAAVDRGADGPAVRTELTVAETAAGDRVFVIVLRDISARLDAEAAARQAGERLHDGIGRITDGFALFGPDRRLVICNDRFLDMLGEAGATARPGVRFDTIMERYAETSRAPVDAVDRARDWLGERMAAFVRAAEPRVQECLDGRWFRIDERPTAEGGLVGVYSDITELKWREMEMSEAMLRAEAASSAKSTFLANMSHELRTPLNAVIGFADLMKRELFGPLGNEHYRAYVADIIDSGSKLLAMIEAILEFSRSEHASLAETGKDGDMQAAVEAVLRDVRPAALERDVTVAAEVQEGMPSLAVDEAILYQIMQNLVSNAVKFSPTGSRVTLRAFVSDDGRPAMVVTDHGLGIPADMIEKVTQPFWQRQGPLVRSHGGVGLGLAIVKAHVDTLGGELRFESEVDRGTTVTVLLPDSLKIQSD
ncbi:CHASE2 domain-containing protein [Thalassobaculum sp.]|uniref:CHASE2 domain-containing protein n=1 Tax=Thalassobaculum sp. TaxID=2022740 RepID=UPI0032EDBEA5